ncbi:MAG: hydroxymethylpyrimidine/phosphomethylpyrimidine kinase [Verrucomicrobiota bacterium]
MLRIPHCPVALTIAGSDSSGGAGIQADLKTFAALGVHGASTIACLTAQNPGRVLAVECCSPGILRQQIEAVFEELPPAAVKTGMLFSAENVRVVAEFFKARYFRRDESHKSQISKPKNRDSQSSSLRFPPLVVDPVMVSTSGASLLKPAAIKLLKEKLLPLAELVTPNLFEAETLTGRKLASVEDLRTAAREIHARFGCAALVKGGHLPGGREAVDIFYDGRTELLLSAPFLNGISTHGTGCTYSAAIAGYLARGLDLPQAVKRAKEFITQAIAGSYRIGKHFALNPLFH